jgi:LemA protein
MVILLATTLVVTVVAGSFLVSRYNSFVQVHEDVDKAWANIEVMLKQRSDELPKLIDTATHFLAKERAVLQDLTEARAAVQQAEGPHAEAEADQQLRGALGNLFAVAEDYPELQASEQFQQLQARISALEERIADRREFYNESATRFNARARQIPDIVFARSLDLDPRELFQVDADDLRDVDLGARLADASDAAPTPDNQDTA